MIHPRERFPWEVGWEEGMADEKSLLRRGIRLRRALYINMDGCMRGGLSFSLSLLCRLFSPLVASLPCRFFRDATSELRSRRVQRERSGFVTWNNIVFLSEQRTPPCARLGGPVLNKVYAIQTFYIVSRALPSRLREAIQLRHWEEELRAIRETRVCGAYGFVARTK